MLQLLGEGATHVGVACDTVIESWRNDLWPTYKDGSGVPWELKSQFPLLEDACEALGLTVWRMVEDEADDALGSAAVVGKADDRVGTVFVCTPDKDMGQCVGGKVVQYDRRKRQAYDADGIREKFGVDPESIPDYLALVGHSADGYPGLKGWGKSSAAAVLQRWKHLDAIPADASEWEVNVRNSRGLAATLQNEKDTVLLFRVLATLRDDCDVGTVDDWAWAGPTPEFTKIAEDVLESPDLVRRADELAARAR
jgi:5'-3' exonuclease